MTFRLRGDSRRIKAEEINRWNKLADQHARGELRKIPVPQLRSYDPSSRIALVKNTSGSDRAAFESMAIDGLEWELDTAGTSDIVFKLITADPAKAPAVLLDPIANGDIGRAVLDGLAIALVGGGSGLIGTPDATNHRIKPDSSGSIKLLAAPHASSVRLLPVVLNAGAAGGAGKIFLTPGGGIAARSGTTVSSATCTVYKFVGGTLTTDSTTETVYNPWPVAIPAAFYMIGIKELSTNEWVAMSPGIIDVRWSDPNLEQTLDKATYATIDTLVECL